MNYSLIMIVCHKICFPGTPNIDPLPHCCTRSKAKMRAPCHQSCDLDLHALSSSYSCISYIHSSSPYLWKESIYLLFGITTDNCNFIIWIYFLFSFHQIMTELSWRLGEEFINDHHDQVLKHNQHKPHTLSGSVCISI